MSITISVLRDIDWLVAFDGERHVYIRDADLAFAARFPSVEAWLACKEGALHGWVRVQVEAAYAALDTAGAAVDTVTTPALSREHPKLRELAARYEVSEQKLRLEVARQYPDITLGPNYEREGKTDRYGLSLGISLPLFDQNQRAIADAKAERTAARSRYVAAMRQLQTGIDRDHARLTLAREELTAATEQKRAVTSLRALARTSLEEGTIEPWRYLDALRRFISVARNELVALRAIYDAELALERSSATFRLDFESFHESAKDTAEDVHR